MTAGADLKCCGFKADTIRVRRKCSEFHALHIYETGEIFYSNVLNMPAGNTVEYDISKEMC